MPHLVWQIMDTMFLSSSLAVISKPSRARKVMGMDRVYQKLP